MPGELRVLGLTIVFAIVQLFVVGSVRTRAYGRAWNAGARDTDPVDRRTPLIGRLERAQANFAETFPLFAAAVLGCVLAGRASHSVEFGCWLYLGARVLYLPVYAAGVPLVRSLVWGLSLIGLLHPLWALLR